jgi:putative tricarboxylic transport membrane protein
MTMDQVPVGEERPLLLTRGQRLGQMAVGLGVMGVAVVMAVGAAQMSSDAGYAGVGTDFLPWVVALALAVCGAMLTRQAMSGGFRNAEKPSGADRGDWPAFAWVVAGVIANAALIETVGFVLSCALCYLLAVRGLRQSEGKGAGNWKTTLQDAGVGLALSAPVYWLFTKFLAVNLPGLTGTGWL